MNFAHNVCLLSPLRARKLKDYYYLCLEINKVNNEPVEDNYLAIES